MSRDDLGAVVSLDAPARRVVSLVPSLTESVAATRPEALVGATDWCTHPAGLDVERVRGTKNPDVRRIVALAPDLVLANQEENRRLDVERLRAAGVPVWVTVTETLDGALTSLRRLFTDGLRWPLPGWVDGCAAAWDPVVPLRERVAIPIWRDPWMVVGPRTFTGDLARRAGLDNVFGGATERYPHTDVAGILSHRPDLVLLPDEPYAFAVDDGPDAFPGLPCALVDGRSLTWYGPSLLTAREQIDAALRSPITR